MPIGVLNTWDGTQWRETASTADADAIHDNVAGEIAAITEKAVPVAADLVVIEDSVVGDAKKRLQIGNLSGVIDHDALLNFLTSEHFAVTSIDHTLIANIGTNSHAAIDTHIVATTDPHGSAMTVSVLIICPQLANFGDIIFDASAVADTKVWVKNNDTGRADLDVDRNIILGGTVNGVTVGAHAARHMPGGADILQVSATDKLLGRSTAGAGNVEEIACTAAGRALIDDADAAAQRTTLDVFDQATVIALAAAL